MEASRCSCNVLYLRTCLLTYLLTYTYLLNPWCRVLLEKLSQASQETPRISRNPKVHYRTYKRPPTVSILGQPNPVHIPISHLLDIHLNIIHPSTLRFPQWSLSLPRPYTPPLLTHMCHMPSPSHSSQFYHYYRIKSYNSTHSFYMTPTKSSLTSHAVLLPPSTF